MYLDYKFIKINSNTKNGLIVFYHDNIIHQGTFAFTSIKIENKTSKSVIFTDWSKTTFDGDIEEAEQHYIKSKAKNVILIDSEYDVLSFSENISQIKKTLGKIISDHFSFDSIDDII